MFSRVLLRWRESHRLVSTTLVAIRITWCEAGLTKTLGFPVDWPGKFRPDKPCLVRTAATLLATIGRSQSIFQARRDTLLRAASLVLAACLVALRRRMVLRELSN